MCSSDLVALLCILTVETAGARLPPRRFLTDDSRDFNSEGRSEDVSADRDVVRVQLLVREQPEGGFYPMEGLTVSVWAFDPWSHVRPAKLGEIAVLLSPETGAANGGVELTVPLTASLPPHFLRAKQNDWLVYFLRVGSHTCCRYAYTGEIDIKLYTGAVFMLEPELRESAACDVSAVCSVRDSSSLRTDVRLVGDVPLGGFREGEGLTVTAWGYDSRGWSQNETDKGEPVMVAEATVLHSQLNAAIVAHNESSVVETPSTAVEFEFTLPSSLQVVPVQYLSMFLGVAATEGTARFSFFGFRPFTLHESTKDPVVVEVLVWPGSGVVGESSPSSPETVSDEPGLGDSVELGVAIDIPPAGDNIVGGKHSVASEGLSINGVLISPDEADFGMEDDYGHPAAGSNGSKFVDELSVFELDNDIAAAAPVEGHVVFDNDTVATSTPQPSMVESVVVTPVATAYSNHTDTIVSRNASENATTTVEVSLTTTTSLPTSSPVSSSAVLPASTSTQAPSVAPSTDEYVVRVSLSVSELPAGGIYPEEGVVLQLWVYNQRSLNTEATQIATRTLTADELVGNATSLKQTSVIDRVDSTLVFNNSALPSWANGTIANDAARFYVEVTQPRECCRFSYYSRKFNLVTPNEAEYAPVEATLSRGGCPQKCVPPGSPQSQLPPLEAFKVSLRVLDSPPGGFGPEEGLLLSLWTQEEASGSPLWPTSATPYQIATKFVRPADGLSTVPVETSSIELNMPLQLGDLPNALRSALLDRRARLWVTVGVPGCCRYDYFQLYGGSALVNTWLKTPEATVSARLKSATSCDTEQQCLERLDVMGSNPEASALLSGDSKEDLSGGQPWIPSANNINDTAATTNATGLSSIAATDDASLVDDHSQIVRPEEVVEGGRR